MSSLFEDSGLFWSVRHGGSDGIHLLEEERPHGTELSHPSGGQVQPASPQLTHQLPTDTQRSAKPGPNQQHCPADQSNDYCLKHFRTTSLLHSLCN